MSSVLICSVTKESHAAGDMSTLNVRVEAFRLSSQALELHRNGTLPAVPCCKARDVEGEGDVVYLNTVVRGAAAGADDSSEVDSVLLCVPVAIRSSGSAGSGTVVGAGDGVDAGAMETEKKIELEMEMQHLFPSMAELQHDPLVAEVARQYLLKLLGRVTQPLRDNSTSEGGEPLEARLLSRFRDPQLLLYLSTVMEPEAFGGLCEQLRSVDAATTISKRSIIGSRTLPLEVQVALEQVRLSLL